MMDEKTNRVVYEDEIDLKELLFTLIKNKMTILILTSVFTVFAIAYSLLSKQVYEVRAIVEIGKFNGQSLDDSNRLVKELDTIFIENEKNIKDKELWIESLDVEKKNPLFINISSRGFSNELAEKKLNEVLNYIQKKHLNFIEDRIKGVKNNISTIERKIENAKKNTLKEIEDQISFLKNNKIKSYEDQIKTIENSELKLLENKKNVLEKSLLDLQDSIQQTKKNYLKVIDSNPTLGALILSDIKDMRDKILDIKIRLDELEAKRYKIANSDLPKLRREMLDIANIDLKSLDRKKEKLLESDIPAMEEEKKIMELSVAPYNYSNTEVVGEIIKNDYAVKPKKMLIVAVSFVTGFILSVFAVFLREFLVPMLKELKEMKNEE